MFHRVIGTFVLSFSILLAACAPPGAPPATPTIDATSQVRAAMQHYDQLTLAMDAKGIASLFTSDGEMVDSGNVIAQGPTAIQAFLAPFNATVHVEAQASKIEAITINGDTATVIGTYQQKALMLTNNQEVQVQGRFTAIWVRQPDGQWLVQKFSTIPS